MVPRAMAEKLIKLLVAEVATAPRAAQRVIPTDELILSCLEGQDPRCSECKVESSLVVPSRLLFRCALMGCGFVATYCSCHLTHSILR